MFIINITFDALAERPEKNAELSIFRHYTATPNLF